ncbi:Uncharacterized protein Fot_37517 [Forsythia ovata]|uniref:Uncharacterized protein n=1 Tax=Forsythia ovata TaxID=205694 RepID=A0ABD1RZ81_9LAMI
MALPPTQFSSPSALQTGKFATTLDSATSPTAILTIGTLTKPSKSTPPSPMPSPPLSPLSFLPYMTPDSTTCKALSKVALLSSVTSDDEVTQSIEINKDEEGEAVKKDIDGDDCEKELTGREMLKVAIYDNPLMNFLSKGGRRRKAKSQDKPRSKYF